MSYDINLFSSAENTDNFDLNDVACSGASKALNTFLLLLLSDNDDAGVEFVKPVLQGVAKRDDELNSLFSLAVLAISMYLRPLEQDIPDTEAFKSAKLISWTSDGDRIMLTVSVTNRADESITAVTPMALI